MSYRDWVRGQELHYSDQPGGGVDFRLPIVLKWLSSCRRVLDCGIHTGAITRRIAEEHQVVGLDLPKVLHTYPNKSFPVVGADAIYLPFKNQVFDGGWAGELIEHLKFPEIFLSEIHRVLTPSGLLAVSTPEGQQASLRHSTHCNWFNEKGLRNLSKPFFRVLEVSRPKRDCLMMLMERRK